MSTITKWIDRKLYPGFSDKWDDKLFRERILAEITSDSRVLDLGAGRGAKPEMDFRGKCRFVAGVDPDNAVFRNPYLDEAKLLAPPDYRIPYADESFDVIFSNCVLEHINNTDMFFDEVRRVLKPDGVFLAKTPNQYHYVAMIAQITPHWFHEFYNHLRGRERHDTFPTTYACNTKQKTIQAAQSHALVLTDFTIVEGRPEYLRISAISYVVGLAYERLVNHFTSLEPFRCVIMFRLTKKKEQAG